MTVVPCVLMQAESSLSRQPSESRGAESKPSTLTQGDSSTSGGQEAADWPQAEQVGVILPLWGLHRTAHNLPAANLPPTEQIIPVVLHVLAYQLVLDGFTILHSTLCVSLFQYAMKINSIYLKHDADTLQ